MSKINIRNISFLLLFLPLVLFTHQAALSQEKESEGEAVLKRYRLAGVLGQYLIIEDTKGSKQFFIKKGSTLAGFVVEEIRGNEVVLTSSKGKQFIWKVGRGPATHKNFPKGTVSFGGHHYFLVNKALNYQTAKIACSKLGAHLLTLSTAAENNFAKGFIKQNCWLGLTDVAKEGSFVWADGPALDYANWSPNEPNNVGRGGEDFVELLILNGKWNDLNANNRRTVVCEWDH